MRRFSLRNNTEFWQLKCGPELAIIIIHQHTMDMSHTVMCWSLFYVSLAPASFRNSNALAEGAVWPSYKTINRHSSEFMITLDNASKVSQLKYEIYGLKTDNIGD